MQELQFDYYRGMEAEQYTFYRIPKVLFTAECFKSLSCEAKVLYGLLLDRMSLSIKNRWFDEEDRVYIIFTVEYVMELLNCSRQKAIKNLAELDSEKGIGLIEKKRLGLGKPNVIYVKNFIIKENPEKEEKELENAGNTQKYENHNSRSMKNELQEVPKSYSNDTDINKTDLSDTEFSETEYSKTDFNDTESGVSAIYPNLIPSS
ncbi:MAG: replication initiator protein A, partial [Lachnospiraceae bacterium]|nr:replication initiator protein A [Lachnospiraceae bacterium]